MHALPASNSRIKHPVQASRNHHSVGRSKPCLNPIHDAPSRESQEASRPRQGRSPPESSPVPDGSSEPPSPTPADRGPHRRLIMPVRKLPVTPDLDQLRHQAKDLLRSIHAGDSSAVAELREFHPDNIN